MREHPVSSQSFPGSNYRFTDNRVAATSHVAAAKPQEVIHCHTAHETPLVPSALRRVTSELSVMKSPVSLVGVC
ncbi:hypothetical protein V22_00680 [Calycomorphotria hydatis]|uniref:Uncharacterized protein n=1 Tax=Calycomorphotria hydatis TaxID=2528027 RepID=A0A517T3C4_9PLAN|nr:hypothetical protein V22_00680 [Calycomorphotria hydatis]